MKYQKIKFSRINQLVYTLIIGASLITPIKTLAHGSNIQYRTTQAIEIKATYDNGEPMENAQIVIYAPDNTSTPWLNGITNKEGIFNFIPDPSKPGSWNIKVFQSGHGKIIKINLDGSKISSFQNVENNSSETFIQKIIVAAIGIWGCVGTALFFTNKKA